MPKGDLGCVELQRLATPPPPTLFSPPAPVLLHKASDLDDDKEVKIFRHVEYRKQDHRDVRRQVVVEATVGAVTKLGMFIGEKVF